MTKRDYELIADVLRDGPLMPDRLREDLAESFAERLARGNPRFDREKFLRACGGGRVSLTIPHFPELEDGSGHVVCPGCLEVLAEKVRPNVHWIERHDGQEADVGAARRLARGEADEGRDAPGEEAPVTAEATQEKVDKRVAEAIRKAGGSVKDLDDEQRARALEPPAGMGGKALGTYVLDGTGTREETARAASKRGADAAEKKRQNRSSAAKASGAKPPARKSDYPEPIREAVKAVYEIKGTRHGSPGPKQHVHVRSVVAREVGAPKPEDVTKAQLVQASGYKSLGALTKVASGEAPREDLKALRDLADKMGADQFCKGRNLAAILVAWSRQMG